MKADEIQRVLVIGAGRMGTEIGLHCALYGISTILYDCDSSQLEKALAKHKKIIAKWIKNGRISKAAAADIVKRIQTTQDPQTAARDTDLISEALPERPPLKAQVLAEFHKLCPAKTIFTSNTSHIPPSLLAKSTGRPDRFAALHFHQPLWESRLVDVMPHDASDPNVMETLKQFAMRIGHYPVMYSHDKHGYIYNALIAAQNKAAIELVESGTASPEDIDRIWMNITHMKRGPFGHLDDVGIDTARDITALATLVSSDEATKKALSFLNKMVDQGRLGEKSGRGFYTYPNPAYQQPDFLPCTKNHGPLAPAQDSEKAGTAGIMRLVLRCVPSLVHLKLQHKLQIHGPALILGSNPTAMALQKRLVDQGASVQLLPSEAGLNETLEKLDQHLVKQAHPHLFIMTARDEDATIRLDRTSWIQRYERGILTPYFVCQRWYQQISSQNIQEQATLVAATSLGGDFGIANPVDNAEGGGLTALLKSLFMESAMHNTLGPQIRVIDAAANESPDALADFICKETALVQASLVTGSREELEQRYVDLEIAYRQGVRHVVRLEQAPITQNTEPDIRPESVWVVTGGARGITAYIVRELGRKYRLRLHLLGRTALPESDSDRPTRKQEEIRQTLERLRSDGAQAMYHACDVGDPDALTSVLTRIREDDGPIEGIIHGAGVGDFSTFLEKQAEIVERTVAPKVKGMMTLMEETRNDPLRYFVVFGSMSGAVGSYRLTDYAMANNQLCKLVVWLHGQRPECKTIAFHWPGWDEVGMLSHQESRETLVQRGHNLMSPEEGLNHFLSELSSPSQATEAIFVDHQEIPKKKLYSAS